MTRWPRVQRRQWPQCRPATRPCPGQLAALGPPFGRETRAQSRRGVSAEAAIRQPNGPASPGSELEIVSDQDQRRSLILVQLSHELDDGGAGAGVQVPGRLVGKENFGTGAECPCQSHSLLLATGELNRIMVLPPAEPHPRQQVARSSARLRLTPQLERDLHIFLSGQGGHELKGLKDKSDLLHS